MLGHEYVVINIFAFEEGTHKECHDDVQKEETVDKNVKFKGGHFFTRCLMPVKRHDHGCENCRVQEK